MNTENHTSLIITVLIWANGSSLSLFIFWPIVAIISIGVGFITTKILKTVDFKSLIINAFISIPLASLVIFTLGHLSYTQPEWQAALYPVTAVHIFAFYFGGIIFLWRRRISRHSS